MITVIDYKYGGNVFSVLNSLKSLKINCQLSSNPDEINNSSKILFPGVGSFQTAMEQLDKLGLKEILTHKALDGTWFLGICVGMQVLFEHGEEGSSPDGSKGLGIIPGSVNKFCSRAPKIPHMGWNQIKFTDNISNPIFKGVSDQDDFYFVHSYRAGVENIPAIKNKFPNSSFMTTEFGTEFISSWWNGEKLFACQFHPEKSGENGLKILENFASL
jgi:imidazole glycerol phosphate synthase glutamine amidotransferase subunit